MSAEPQKTAEPLPPARGNNAQLRGDEARLRIVEISIQLFGDYGYDGTSTRKIATEAKVNLAAIPYYFGDKAGLYKAALDHVIEYLDSVFRPMAQHVAERLAHNPAPSGDTEWLFGLLFALFDQWRDIHLGYGRAPMDKSWRKLMTRAELEPPEDESWLYKSTAALTLAPCTALISRILQKSPEDEECVLLAISVLGQIYPFRRQRDGQVPAAGWDEINRQRHDRLSEILRRNIRAIILAALENRLSETPPPFNSR